MNGAANVFTQAHHGQTTIHPLGLMMVVLAGIAMMLTPRRYAIWPMIVIVCFVPTAQRLVLLGADFTLLRVMLLFGVARIVARNEARGLTWQPLDWAVLAWAVYAFLIVVLRLGPAVLANRLGMLYDMTGMYFLFRMLVRDWDDVRQAIKGLTWISLPVAALFLVEQFSGRNLFSIFGGVPDITAVRDGRLRCQGAFDHPILAGCFFASIIPLIVSQWWERRPNRVLLFSSVSACVFIVVASASATPITALILAAVGAMFFRFRRWMQPIRWAVLGLLILLHLIMHAPVWHLISRISVSSGSAWHRFALIDGAIRHLDEWWLVGSDVGSGHWGHFTFDVTNYYVVQGLHGGLPLLLLFIGTIAFAFRSVGKLWRRVEADREHLILAWAIGVSLFVHVTNHFGVTYFGQVWMAWYLLLAMIGSLASYEATASAARTRSRVTTRRRTDTTESSPVCGVLPSAPPAQPVSPVVQHPPAWSFS